MKTPDQRITKAYKKAWKEIKKGKHNIFTTRMMLYALGNRLTRLGHDLKENENEMDN